MPPHDVADKEKSIDTDSPGWDRSKKHTMSDARFRVEGSTKP